MKDHDSVNHSGTAQNLSLENQIDQLREQNRQLKAQLHEQCGRTAFLNSIFNSTSAGLAVIDAATHKIIDINDSACRTLGYKRSELLGQSCHRFICPKEPGNCPVTDHHRHLEQTRATLIHKDGSYLPILKTVMEFRHEQKTYLLESFINLRKQMKDHEITALNENEIRDLLEHLPVGVYRTTPDGRFLLANSALSKILGFDSVEELPEGGVEYFYSSDYSREQFKAHLEEKNELKNFRFQLKRKDGRVIHVRENAKAISDERGNVLYYEGTIEDITESVKNKEHLRKLTRAVEQNPASIVITDLDGRIEYVNPAFCNITGYSKEEAIGENPRVLKSGKHDNAFYKELWDTITAGHVWTGEFYNKRKDGSFYWESAMIAPVKDQSDQITHFVAMKLDITRQKHLIEELKEAKLKAEASARAKSEFLANMSHEIRTPLNGIIGMTGLLLDSELSSLQKEFAETIRISGDALLSIINDILDFSKIESGKLDLEIQSFSLRDLIEESLDLIANRASEKNLELGYAIAPGVPAHIKSDSTRLRQVLVNLLSNAVKFTDEGSVSIDIQARELNNDDYQLIFGVEDTGIGIPRDRISKLFSAFTQADASTTRKYGGTGLGLAISKRLVEILGGQIWVQSKENVGTTFFFTIRAKQSEAEEDDSRYHQNVINKKVLLVDDNPVNRRTISLQLKSFKMECYTYSNAPAALQELQTYPNRYDLILMDMLMPDMDGVQMARNIRQELHIKNLPLIMLTSIYNKDHFEVADKAMFHAILHKPVKQSQLFNAIVRVFKGASEKKQIQKPSEKTTKEDLSKQYALRILIAEDNNINQRVLIRLLSKLGYKAYAVSDGNEAVNACKTVGYDLILMDIHMPEMDGVEATKQIRNMNHQSQKPFIIALTADALQGAREKYLSAGMNNYLSKPVELKALRSAVIDAAKQMNQ